ncbi:S-layer-like y domain-containing protein [Cohnella lubricantis]|uniref:S-layer homology domain-containing protein n=1 Tax=Cohnella lubricantis TaxID=2163172 RepID=A0A841T9F9_9BACL|nr:S-layer homology domain-containing protein [Cohnella lubricantis]MBB6675880.1 S-layer homology domain-containing protein [Cohnella lubricantis]MBP2117203.1 hypothetical protein [Cohnella lubricantis]
MTRMYRWLSALLVGSLLLGVMPMAGAAAGAEAAADSSEIWPGYPGVDELPAINTIPDPFKFFSKENDPSGDGYVSSPAEWTARREEIKDLVQRYWLGYRWPTQPESVVGVTYETEEPNVISVGFDWPPISTATEFNLKEEFDKLADQLLAGAVDIHELIPPANPFGAPTVGEVKITIGPAADEADAVAKAIEAWNAGYYLPYTSFGTPNYAVLKDYTGELTAPPDPMKPVTYNTVKITNPNTGVTADFDINVRMPSVTQVVYAWGDENAQVPVIIDIGGAISQLDTVNEQGYAYISFTPTDIYPDDSNTDDGINRDGVYTQLYPYDKDEYEYASGALMAWGWGASQIISALEQPIEDGTQTWGEQLRIDPAKTLVTGHSRYGKAAMFAAAFDDRFDICLPSESGGSGIQSYRYKVEGKIFNFNVYPKADRVYGKTEIPTVSYGSGSSWFPETAGQFVNKDNQLPFDSSDIISLVAPRPFFATTGIDAHWLGNEGAVAAVQAASEVYDYIGNDELERKNIAVRARESNHALYNRDLAFVIAIMDREFKQDSDQRLHVQDLFPDGDGSLGSMTYPEQDYDNVGEFNSYPFDINSSYLPWSSPDKYTLWTAQENFLVGYPVTIAAHSNAPDVKLYLPNGTAVDAASHEGEMFTFNLAASQAVYGRYELRTAGDDKLDRSVFFAAVSLADALRHATSKGDEGEENRLIGFSSRIANDAANPPEVYIDGERTTMSFTPERFKTEETTLLEYGILFHDPLFVRIANEGWDASKTFDIKNLKFVTIPEFTFEVSFGNIYASAANSGKEGAANFTQPISWNVEKFNNGPAEEWPVIPDTKAEKDALLAGETVTRPDAPAPTATAFDTEIVGTKVERSGGKTNVVISFDEELDTREFGFGLDVADHWDTTWSADKKQVTLSVDYDEFPRGASADLIIFRLKDAEGNLIPGPIYLPLTFPNTPGGNPGTPDTPPSTDAPTTPDPATNTVTMQPALDGSTGVVKLDDAKAAAYMKQKTTINVPELAGATAYSLGLPAAGLTGGEDGGALTVSTALGSVTIPSDMLAGITGTADSAAEAGITIAQGNKDALPAEVRDALGDRPIVQITLTIDGQPAEWNNPDSKVEVSIPYKPTAEELANPDQIVVWYIDGSGQPIAVPSGRYDAKSGAVTFRTTHFSQYAVAYVAKSFSGIAKLEWAKPAIEALAARGILMTRGDTFEPSVPITRADFLYGLVRSLDLNAKTNGNFDDVTQEAYYYNEIAIARALGITTGRDGNTFAPDDSISRQEMMTLTARTLALLGKLKQEDTASALDKFTDKADIAPYAVDSAAALVSEGLILGSNGKLMPKGNTTRAEAAVFLYRLYNLPTSK